MPPSGEAIRLRLMTRADIPFGMSLKEAAGWNQTPGDWEAFLRLRPGGAFVAEMGGRPVGTVTTVDYERGFGWVGMVLVAPEFRRRGVGTRLLEAGIESLASCGAVRLDATPEGRELYLRLGFHDEYGLSRQVRSAGSLPRFQAPPAGLRPAGEADLAAIAAFDAPAFGRPRRLVLDLWRARAPGLAFVLEGPGGLRGYALGRQGSRFDHLGPLVASDFESARALLFAALAAVGSRPVLLDAFLHEPRWLELLGGLGFREERGFTRMARGPNRHPGEPRRQWAASGPELG